MQATQPVIISLPGKMIKVSVWVAQSLAATVFVLAGVLKTATPIPELATMIPWTAEYAEDFVRMIGLIDLTGGLGLILPSLTRIQPGLTVLSAGGCSVLQVLAIIFHISRGEAMVTPLNTVLLALSLFILWVRWKRLPIAGR